MRVFTAALIVGALSCGSAAQARDTALQVAKIKPGSYVIRSEGFPGKAETLSYVFAGKVRGFYAIQIYHGTFPDADYLMQTQYLDDQGRTVALTALDQKSKPIAGSSGPDVFDAGARAAPSMKMTVFSPYACRRVMGTCHSWWAEVEGPLTADKIADVERTPEREEIMESTPNDQGFDWTVSSRDKDGVLGVKRKGTLVQDEMGFILREQIYVLNKTEPIERVQVKAVYQ